MRILVIPAVLLMFAGTGLAQDAINPDGLADPAGRPYSPFAERAFPTDVYFGDTHVHTGLSADAGGGGTRLMPRDAYRLARGEQIQSNTGQPVKLRKPLDFYMVTDHSDAMGAITDIIRGAPNILADEQGRRFHEAFAAGGEEARVAAFELTAMFAQGEVSPALNYQPGNPAYASTWDDIIAAAEEFNNPGVFSTFIAYEWTSLVGGRNLHRNVIFRDGAQRAGQTLPYTTTPPVGSPDPRDLWQWMQNYEAETGGRVLAIPHNGNLSNGWMFPLRDDFDKGARFDAAYAETRARWEPLYEATQIKGDSEAHPLLSPEDEFADFETFDYGNLDASEAKTAEMLPGEYVRSGLQRGLMLERKLGTNPYKFGLVGASDTHTGMTTVAEDNNFHKFTAYEPGPERTEHVSKTLPDGAEALWGWSYSASGLTAVWAEENTRTAIWDAMARRETYATTGTRLRLRFFGGWDFNENDALRRDLGQIGYTKGVPMGSDLRPGDGAPSFLVYALRDSIGANLDRIQIIKGWLDADDKPREKVYDVAWSDERQVGADGKLPAVGSTVNLELASYTNTTGSAELGAVWTDPDFDPEQRAFYYARVIEIPTPRWTAYDAARFDIELPDEVPLTVQERAYSSPIWYTPE